MSGHRYANCNWDGTINSVGDGTLAVLQDIRTELQSLNRLLHCSNFIDIPRRLDKIRIATARIPARKKRKVKKP